MKFFAGHASTLLLFVALQATAQTAEICNAAFAGGIRDNYSVLSEREQYEQYQKRVCDAKYSSYSNFQQSASGLKLDVPVAEGLIGLTGTQDQKSAQFQTAYSNYCSSSFFSSQYRERFASYSNQVSTALTSSWLECQKVHVSAWLEANKKGVFIAVTPQDNFVDFTVTVFRKGAVVPGPIRINDITPAGSSSCVREASPFKSGTQVAQYEFQFTCAKSPGRQLSFAIDTNDGVSNTVLVPGNASKLAELNDKMTAQHSALRSELDSLRQELGRARQAAEDSRAAMSNDIRRASETSTLSVNQVSSSVAQLNGRPKFYVKIRQVAESCTNYCKSGAGGAANGTCVTAYSNNQSASCEKRDTPMLCVCVGDPQTPH